MGTSDFAKGMQDNINLYVTWDRHNNANFRQKLDPITKKTFYWQNALELVFKDISIFDVQNAIVGSPLQGLHIGKKDVASSLLKRHHILLISIYKAD